MRFDKTCTLATMTGHLVYTLNTLVATNHCHALTLFVQPAQHLPRIRAAKVIACYLAALPPESHLAEPNPWTLGSEGRETQTCS
jgi:hypothetical protein